jgi:hypothetical protein
MDHASVHAHHTALIAMQDMEMRGPAPTTATQQEHVSARAMGAKAAALRDRCQGALGYHFPQASKEPGGQRLNCVPTPVTATCSCNEKNMLL